tara:strand:- start:325 stop:573 length:249 start_codon:yes stop_codon:yes gene_type:complete
MKTKRNRKLTNNEIKTRLNELRYNQMVMQSQTTNLMEIFNEFLEFTHKKAKFMEHLESKTEKIDKTQDENDTKQQCIGDEVI